MAHAGIDIQIPILARQYIGEEVPSQGPECGLRHSTASIELFTKKIANGCSPIELDL
jgi:hypothetical protein